jgi:hypothetical protein
MRLAAEEAKEYSFDDTQITFYSPLSMLYSQIFRLDFQKGDSPRFSFRFSWVLEGENSIFFPSRDATVEDLQEFHRLLKQPPVISTS